MITQQWLYSLRTQPALQQEVLPLLAPSEEVRSADSLTKEQSHPRTLCSAVKAQGKEEKFHSPLLRLSSQLLHSFLKMVEQLPTNRKY